MKNFIKTIFALSVIILNLSACSRNSNPPISGKWEMSRTIKTEMLYEQNVPSSVFGYFYIRQIIQYDFAEDNTFSKTIEQKFEKTEYLEEANFLTEEQKADIQKSLESMNSVYVLKGSFQQKSKKINFTLETCAKDGDVLSFQEASKNDPKLLSHAKPAKYKFEGDKLILTDEVGNLSSFKKAL